MFNKLEQLEFKLYFFLEFRNMQEKLEKYELKCKKNFTFVLHLLGCLLLLGNLSPTDVHGPGSIARKRPSSRNVLMCHVHTSPQQRHLDMA